MNAPADGSNEKLGSSSRLDFSSEVRWANHRVFRYPAKFHPPVAKTLVERFTSESDVVIDPFCGSGTLLVECAIAGRSNIGTDIDPLAVFIADAKTTRYDIGRLEAVVEQLRLILSEMREKDIKRDGDLTKDISAAAYARRLARHKYEPPKIPRLHHWFRYRVILQLCQIRQLIAATSGNDADLYKFLHLAFGSIIRNASNADPVPVSGLEVTAHMLKKEAEGREVDTLGLMARSLIRCLAFTKDFEALAANKAVATTVLLRNASTPWLKGPRYNAIITSPPYLSAVDYYRRHQLEMYWLGLVASHSDRLSLMPSYIGRPNISKSAVTDMDGLLNSAIYKRWRTKLRNDPARLRALTHYAAMMKSMLDVHASNLHKKGVFVLVIGNGKISGEEFPTSSMLEELASTSYALEETLWYPIRNRYMSYSRRNGADINVENVLVFRKR